MFDTDSDNGCADAHFNHITSDIDRMSVELVDKCIRDLKKGKACGPDGLCSESLVSSHPKLVTLLCSLFRSMALHSFVPASFGKGIIVPLIKDKTGNISSCTEELR